MNTAREIPDLFDDNGLLADPDLWNREPALRIAAQLDIGELEASHWAVIDYLREHYLVSATLPWEGNVCRDLDLVDDCSGSSGGRSRHQEWQACPIRARKPAPTC